MKALLALLTALSVTGYLLASAMLYRLGFPLDDAWIHQTYARNLALHGEWAFLPGPRLTAQRMPRTAWPIAGKDDEKQTRRRVRPARTRPRSD